MGWNREGAADRGGRKAGDYSPGRVAGRPAAGESPLKLWREHRGLTLQALAERAGCTRKMLSMTEHGKVAPSADWLARLAAALGCDMDDLHGG